MVEEAPSSEDHREEEVEVVAEIQSQGSIKEPSLDKENESEDSLNLLIVGEIQDESELSAPPVVELIDSVQEEETPPM